MLSDAKVRTAKPRKLTDSHRLYLLVSPGGSKLWKWSYAYDGKQKTMHLGIYPLVTLVAARPNATKCPRSFKKDGTPRSSRS